MVRMFGPFMAPVGAGGCLKGSRTFAVIAGRPSVKRLPGRRAMVATLATGLRRNPKGVAGKGGARRGADVSTSSGLREVPGIGPKNEALLMAKGIDSIPALNSMFRTQLDRDEDKLTEFLRQDVGIRHRGHCASIASYIANASSKERVTFSVEGNISAGKSTFLSNLLDTPMELRDLVEVVHEPVDMWQKVGDDANYNFLDRYYSDPKRFAYEFQNYVFLTRLKQNHQSYDGEKPLRLLERSVFSDRLVFVRAVHEAKWMDDFHLKLYDAWFQPFLREVPGLVPDGFIYLRADPSTCLDRLRRRSRREEVGVDLSYLEGLHVKHEDWFYQEKVPKREAIETRSILYPRSQGSEAQIVRAPEPPDLPALPKELEGSVIWLGGKGVLSAEPLNDQNNVPNELKAAISSIPALVLDCNEDFDVERDIDRKKQYASTVSAYFDYVKACMAARKAGAGDRTFYRQHESEALRRKWDFVNNTPAQVLQELQGRRGPAGLTASQHDRGATPFSEEWKALREVA
ncbi:unnamed protein product [Ostreobium quekettii]|uniref:Deoxynucleoside kinase domain-containing protein n=1 Tax=Ostreobium quekettii TaxID=121088 RepID=A0A8S1J9H4_9CHLO|nr:unnamed protein product [Ostreobium quekettii]|eukprot:evm.model.scf_1084.6 EVM.evm.TU.scf_1084.6   scf_1084:25475-27451(+)